MTHSEQSETPGISSPEFEVHLVSPLTTWLHFASSLPPRTDRGEAPLSLGQAVSLQRLVG